MKRLSSVIGIRHQKNSNGFTLVEIIVVLFIFMTITLMVVMNTDFAITDEKKVSGIAENVMAKIKLAKQSSILQHTPIRLNITLNEYGFQKLQQQEKGGYAWVWIENDNLLKKNKIDNNIAMQIDRPLELYPNGRFTPFKLTVANRKNNVHFEIVGHSNGEMELTRQ